jgi:hypothetical protein
VAVGNDNCRDTMTMVVQVRNSGCLNIAMPVTVFNPTVFQLENTDKSNTSITEDVKISSNQFNLYPNPNKGSFTIGYKEFSNNVKIEVVDILGRTVGATVNFNYGQKTIEVNCHQVKTGNYFIVLYHEDGNRTRIKFNITE